MILSYRQRRDQRPTVFYIGTDNNLLTTHMSRLTSHNFQMIVSANAQRPTVFYIGTDNNLLTTHHSLLTTHYSLLTADVSRIHQLTINLLQLRVTKIFCIIISTVLQKPIILHMSFIFRNRVGQVFAKCHEIIF